RSRRVGGRETDRPKAWERSHQSADFGIPSTNVRIVRPVDLEREDARDLALDRLDAFTARDLGPQGPVFKPEGHSDGREVAVERKRESKRLVRFCCVATGRAEVG